MTAGAGDERLVSTMKAMMICQFRKWLPWGVGLWFAACASAEVKLPWNSDAPTPADQPAQEKKPQPAKKPANPDDEGPPSILKSPDGKSAVRIVDKPMPGTDGVTDFFTLEVLRDNKVVMRVATEGYLISAYWNAECSKVAVNNRRGNSGDYMWVFSLPDGKVLKKADDRTGEAWMAAAAKALKASGQSGGIYKGWLNATGWSAGGDLEINSRMRLEGGAGFDFKACAAFKDGKWKLAPGKIVAVPED